MINKENADSAPILSTQHQQILLEQVFDDDPLYMFSSYRNRFAMLERFIHPYMDEPPYASEAIIGELSLKLGAAMTYLYDFGDNWQFDVVLERIDPADKKIKGPVLLAFHGEAPDQYPDGDDY